MRLHQRIFARADHLARLVGQRTIDRDEIGAAQQFVELDLGRAARANVLGAQIGVVGQHLHAKQPAAQFGDAPADIAEPDDADGSPEHFAAGEVVAIAQRAGAQRAIAFAHPLDQAQHHAEHVLGDRFGVAAGLIDDEDAALGAVLDVTVS